MDEDDDAVPRPFRASTLQDALDELEVRYRETGNPVFVWQALAAQKPPRLHAKYTGRSIPPVFVPEWAAEYLLSVASRISFLSDGVRIKFARSGRWRLSVVREGPTAAMQDVTASLLKLTEQGGNAFKNYQSTILAEWTSARLESLQRAGHSRDETIARIKAESGHVDSSVIAKRAALGSRIRAQLQALRLKKTAIH